MTSTDVDRVQAKRAANIAELRASLRLALAEVLDPADVEMVAVDAERELGEFRFRQLAEERAGRPDPLALLRVVFHDVLAPQKRRTESGCFWGRWRTVELRLKERLGL